jgi:hypothetical protein
VPVVKQISSWSSSNPYSLLARRVIFLADFVGLTPDADALTTPASRSGEIEVSMVRLERRRRLETRCSSFDTVEPFRFSAMGLVVKTKFGPSQDSRT